MPYTPEVREDPKIGLAAEMLRGHGRVCLELRGTSMLPSLWPGDLLTIQNAAYCEVVPGDIVLVMRDNRFFVHRLIERQQDRDRILWITRGDSVPQNDPPVSASELLGLVVGVRRGHHSLVPSREVSRLRSVLAWMLCRWDHFRGLALRIHAVRLQAGLTRGQFFPAVFGGVRRFPEVSLSPGSNLGSNR
jgi:signal peptidase I